MSMLSLLYLFLKISRVVCIIWFHPCSKFCSLCVRGSREQVELLRQDLEERECDWGWDERLGSQVLASLPDFTMDLPCDAAPFPWSREGACLMPCTTMTASSREEFFVDCSCLHKLALAFTLLLCEGQPKVVAAVCASPDRDYSHGPSVTLNPNVPHVGFFWFILFSPGVSEEE